MRAAWKEDGVMYESYLDAVLANARKPAEGDPQGRDMITYVREEVMAESPLSPSIQKELEFLMPGLAGQESRYNMQAVSSANAMGVFQFLPSTWQARGNDPEKILVFREQTRAAAAYMAYIHDFLWDRRAEEFDYIRDEFFDGDQAAFEKYFLVPCIVNSYNTGVGRMSAVVDWFSDLPVGTEEGFAEEYGYYDEYGYDLYYIMTKRAAEEDEVYLLDAYGPDSSQYFERIYMMSTLLEETRMKNE
jgi:hypothetical protein